MKFKVTVRRKHITKGKCGHVRKCAVALAILDKPGVTSAFVGTNELYQAQFRKNRKLYDAVLPERAVRFIEAFDNTEWQDDDDARNNLKPFSFVLNYKEVK